MQAQNQLSQLKQHKGFIYFSTFFGIAVNLTWAILYTIYLKNVDFDDNRCSNVVNWNKTFMIISYIGAGVDFIRLITYICVKDSESTIISFLMNLKLCGLGIASFVVLIGITATFKNDNILPYCENLNNLNLAFVITEWSLLGLICCGSCLILACASCGLAIFAANEDIRELESQLETARQQRQEHHRSNQGMATENKELEKPKQQELEVKPEENQDLEKPRQQEVAVIAEEKKEKRESSDSVPSQIVEINLDNDK
jgi:hypothetical protein